MSALIPDDYREKIERPSIGTVTDTLAPQRAATLPLFEFEVNGEVRRLSKPIALRVGLEEGSWFVDNVTLALFGHGESLEDAVNEFVHDLGYLWQRYQALNVEEVSGHGRELKRILASLTE